MYTTLEGDRSFRGLRNAFKIYKYLFIKKKKTNKKAICFNIYRLQQVREFKPNRGPKNTQFSP